MTEPRTDHLLDELSVVGDEHADLAGRAYLRIKVLEALAGVHLGDGGLRDEEGLAELLKVAAEQAGDESVIAGEDVPAYWTRFARLFRAALATPAEGEDR